MAYKEEYKQEILEQMKTKSIKEISQDTGISQATLYNWKKKMLVEDREKVTINKEDSKNDVSNIDNNTTIEKLSNDNIISQNEEVVVQTVTEKVTSPKKKNKTKQNKEEKTILIKNELSNRVQGIIEEINKMYYVKMQKVNVNQSKYIKKYDKLESILYCKNTNKRAWLELMLVLINEGYRDIVKDEFSKDYGFIDGIIEQYYAKTLKPGEAKKQIDEYCI